MMAQTRKYLHVQGSRDVIFCVARLAATHRLTAMIRYQQSFCCCLSSLRLLYQLYLLIIDICRRWISFGDLAWMNMGLQTLRSTSHCVLDTMFSACIQDPSPFAHALIRCLLPLSGVVSGRRRSAPPWLSQLSRWRKFKTGHDNGNLNNNEHLGKHPTACLSRHYDYCQLQSIPVPSIHLLASHFRAAPTICGARVQREILRNRKA